MKNLEEMASGADDIFSRIRCYINNMKWWQTLLVCGAFLLIFFFQLNFMSLNPDSIFKWSFIRFYEETGAWPDIVPEHHQSRWMLNLPVIFMTKMCGPLPYMTTMVSAFFAIMTLAMIYFTTLEISDKFSAMLAYVSLIGYARFAGSTHTFRPLLFGSFFLLVALFITIRYFKGKIPVWWLYSSGIALGLSWGCKVTVAYWCVGMGLFMLFFNTPGKPLFSIWRLRIKTDILLLAAGFLTVFTVETLALNAFFDLKYGRLEMLTMGHLSHRRNPQYMGLIGYLFSLKRPIAIPANESVKLCLSYVTFFIVSLPVVVMWLRSKSALIFRFIAFSYTTAYIMHCYVVYKVFPFLHPEKPNVRYHLALGVVSIIIVSAGWRSYAELFSIISKFKTVRVLGITAIASLLLLFEVIGVTDMIKDNGKSFFEIHAVTKTLKRAEKHGMPVLMKVKSPFRIKGKITKIGEYKNARRFIAFWGPVTGIPALYTKYPTKVYVKSNKQSLYAVLWGQKPVAGKKIDCAVIDGRKVEIKCITF